jgi:hypothetical protein
MEIALRSDRWGTSSRDDHRFVLNDEASGNAEVALRGDDVD